MMMTAIGLTSGTSLDGVDVALIETDGKRVRAFGPCGYRPYTQKERSLLRQALTEAVNLPQRDARPGILREAERVVTIAHAEAVATFTAQNRILREDVDIVGFHGQTVLHRPAQKMTVQIGDAAALAKAIHIPVMHDFRAADIAAGGQGAPFVPVYHRALAQSLEREGPIVVVNIGGFHRRRDCPDRAAAAESAAKLDRCRWRRPQSHHAAQAARALGASHRRDRGCARLVGGRHRGASVRLSGRAGSVGVAAELSCYDRRPDSDDRRRDRAAVIKSRS